MWTVNIKDKGVKHEAIEIQVEFSNGSESITRNFAGSSKSELDSRIKRQLDALNTRDEDYLKVETGTWTAPVEEEVTKTADELAQEEWLAEWKKYKAAKAGMQELADAGVTPSEVEQAAFDELKTWVAENRKPEYTHLIADSI